jgi:hypothetical protein
MEPNFTLTGDEARALMLIMATSTASLPTQVSISLFNRLNEISQVQPAEQKDD